MHEKALTESVSYLTSPNLVKSRVHTSHKEVCFFFFGVF